MEFSASVEARVRNLAFSPNVPRHSHSLSVICFQEVSGRQMMTEIPDFFSDSPTILEQPPITPSMISSNLEVAASFFNEFSSVSHKHKEKKRKKEKKKHKHKHKKSKHESKDPSKYFRLISRKNSFFYINKPILNTQKYFYRSKIERNESSQALSSGSSTPSPSGSP